VQHTGLRDLIKIGEQSDVVPGRARVENGEKILIHGNMTKREMCLLPWVEEDDEDENGTRHQSGDDSVDRQSR